MNFFWGTIFPGECKQRGVGGTSFGRALFLVVTVFFLGVQGCYVFGWILLNGGICWER